MDVPAVPLYRCPALAGAGSAVAGRAGRMVSRADSGGR